MTSRRLRVLVAPDSFKGSLTAVQVSDAICEGWRRIRPDDDLIPAPLADGGDGTLAAVHAAGGWEWRECQVHDPLDRPVTAQWLRSAPGDPAAAPRAIVEMAAASGLSLVAPSERDAAKASTRGTGELLRCVLDEGIRHVVLGLGGSATTDGGRGLLEALGARFEGPEPTSADLSGLDPRLAELHLRLACDVTNPLLGERGAAAIYGPQKGASLRQLRQLEERLARFADVLEAATGRSERELAGAGAAGGTTFGLACIRDRLASFELVPGVELVMAEVGFDAGLATADVVVTGEGRIDAQTAFGKTVAGVARKALDADVPCVAIGGGIEQAGFAGLAALRVVGVPVAERPSSLDECIAAGIDPIIRAAERVARLIDIGASLPEAR